MWDASKCDLCGHCLVKCHYVNYDKNKAVSEIKLLMERKKADILNSCITCNACIEYCPTTADPANLIYKMQEKAGSPIAVIFKPFLDELIQSFEESKGDSELLEGELGKPVLSFDSFQYNNFPEGTIQSRIFQGMTIIRGGKYHSLIGMDHVGGESLAGKYGQMVIDGLSELGRDIVYLHNEGYLLAHVKARELGMNVPFKYMHLFEYMLDYLKNNQTDIAKLDKKVAYQPNCTARRIPEEDVWVDEIFELIGVERVSRQYDGINALCCCAPIMAVNNELAKKIQSDNVQDAVDNKAEALITVCPNCDAVLGRATTKAGLPKIFITDLCRMALGEIPWLDN